ncbi:uncharacterized protein E0L32_003783 [Thyridium curvatum]|uniref:Major facilitator superfamily (MFS) profile domain-containing protein n=1 Tax=Thyridium curvatum TaxID=1093900 RepID=A0A507BGN5_9PEZI|nr:uncharacterized protein E0L32_003783 [Thyridium curvatum]TPX16489.1 hypothetical protein E0L32_003783 [Thyridium curvatum]
METPSASSGDSISIEKRETNNQEGEHTDIEANKKHLQTDGELRSDNDLARRLTEILIEDGSRPRSSLAEFRAPEDPEGSGENDTGRIERPSGWRWWLVCFAVYSSCTMYGLDTTIAGEVQAAVIDTFHDVSQIAWLGAGFLLGSTASILPYGALYNSFNQKWLYIGGVVLFEAGSALCGGAPSMNALIVGRVIAGVGGTGIYLGSLNYLTALTPPKNRGVYVTFVGFSWGIGCILGPIVGGLFSDSNATWRWAFYINLVIAAVTAPIYLFLFPNIRSSLGLSVKARLASFDYLGFILSMGFWVCYSLGFLSAGSIWPWHDGRTIATIVVFGMLLIAYGVQQTFSILTTPTTRSFPVHLLKSRTQVLLYITTAAAMTGVQLPIYYIPIYFQFVRDDTAIEAAVRLLPFIIVLITSNLLTGYLLPRIKYYIGIYIVSGVLLTIAGALYYVYLDPSTQPGAIYGINVLAGVGAGPAINIGFPIATLKAHARDAVHAITLQNFAQLSAGTIALVIGGQVFQTTSVKNLGAVLGPAGYTQDQIRQAVAGGRSDVFRGLTGELRERATLAITDAIRQDFVLVIVAGAVFLVAGLAMRRERLFP